MANGFFLGGAQTGIAQRRESDREDRKTALAEKTAEEELALRKQGLGLQAAELGLSERRLSADIENNKAGRAIQEKSLTLEERGVKIQEQAQAFKETQEVAQRADKIIADIMGTIKETTTSLRATGKTPEEIGKVVQPLAEQVVTLSGKTGLKTDHYRNQINALIAQPTAVETAAVAGVTEGTKKLAEAGTLESGGVSKEAAAKTAGVKIDDKDIDIRTFMNKDGSLVSKKASDSAGIAEVLAGGGIETKLSVQSPNIQGLTGETAFSPKTIEDTRKNVRESQSNIEALDKAAAAFKKNPESAGIQGKLIEHVGGLIAQIPWGVGDAALEKAGIDKTAVADTRTKARAAIGQVLRLVSQDGSRFSDADRKLAEATLKALDPTADDRTVQQAFKTTLGMIEDQQLKDVDVLRVAGKIAISDLETEEGINKMGEILTSNGMTPEQAVDAISRTRERFKLNGPIKKKAPAGRMNLGGPKEDDSKRTEKFASGDLEFEDTGYEFTDNVWQFFQDTNIVPKKAVTSNDLDSKSDKELEQLGIKRTRQKTVAGKKK
jgi:hypothetical protein